MDPRTSTSCNICVKEEFCERMIWDTKRICKWIIYLWWDTEFLDKLLPVHFIPLFNLWRLDFDWKIPSVYTIVASGLQVSLCHLSIKSWVDLFDEQLVLCHSIIDWFSATVSKHPLPLKHHKGRWLCFTNNYHFLIDSDTPFHHQHHFLFFFIIRDLKHPCA